MILKKFLSLVIYCFLIFLVSLANAQDQNFEENEFISFIKKGNYPTIKKVFKSKEKYNPIIIYSPVIRNYSNPQYLYNISSYSYPGTLVNLPMMYAFFNFIPYFNLQNFNDSTYILIDKKNIHYKFPLTESYKDTNTYKAQIIELLQAMLILKNKEAFNYLFELMSLKGIQIATDKRLFESIIIQNKIAITDSNDIRVTGPITFFNRNPNSNKADEFFTTFPFFSNEYKFKIFPQAKLGKSHLVNNEIVNEPLNLASDNYFDIYNAHRFMFLLFATNQLNFLDSVGTKTARDFVSQWPDEIGYNKFSPADVKYNYKKYFLHSSKKLTNAEVAQIKTNYQVSNISSEELGILSDCAFILDKKNKSKYLLSASINCNTTELANPNTYDYKTVGYKFMEELKIAADNYYKVIKK